MLDRSEAQRRADQVRAFRRELEALSAAGVPTFSAEQRQAVTAYHDALLDRLAAAFDVDRSEGAGQLSRGMRVASFFAAAALMAAAYSAVARFWGRLDVPVQATVLCLTVLTALIGVELAARRERTLYVASLCAAVAYGTVWLTIGELSRALDVPIVPATIWAGALFGVGLAIPYAFRFVLGVALMAVVVALSGSVLQTAGIPWVAAIEVPEIPAMVGLVVAGLGGRLAQIDRAFGAVARLVGLGVALAGLLLLGGFGQLSLIPAPEWAVEAAYQGVTLIACTGLLTIGIWRRWSDVVALSAAALTIFLVTRFVDWFWTALPRYVFFLVLAALALVWLVVLQRIRTRLAGR